MKRKILALGLIALMILSHPALAMIGNEGANAGDEVGLEFQACYQAALAEIKAGHPDLQAKLQSTPIDFIAETVQVVVVDEPLQVRIGELLQDSVALNFADKNLILVNRTRWGAISSVNVRKSLALHELLSLVGLESTSLYPLSSVYLSRILATSTSVEETRR